MGVSGLFGAFTIKGSGTNDSNWSGIKFRDANNADSGTLMMHPSYSGFYRPADAGWRWYVSDGGVSYQPGSATASDFCTAGGICLSTRGSGGGGVTSLSAGTGITLSPNPITTTGTITNSGVTSVNGVAGAVTVGGVPTGGTAGQVLTMVGSTPTWVTPVAPSGLGNGQTWQNMKTVGRLNGATHPVTNDTSKPIYTCINGTGSGSAYGYVRLRVGGVLVAANNSDYATYGKDMSACAVIPPGVSYTGEILSGSYDSWMELR